MMSMIRMAILVLNRIQHIFNEFIILSEKLFPATAEYYVSKYANDEPYKMLNRRECERGKVKIDHEFIILYANHIFNGF